jgi:hypothetical protein
MKPWYHVLLRRSGAMIFDSSQKCAGFFPLEKTEARRVIFTLFAAQVRVG